MIGTLLGWVLVLVASAVILNRPFRHELYDIVEFHWSRWRARRRLPGARLVELPRGKPPGTE